MYMYVYCMYKRMCVCFICVHVHCYVYITYMTVILANICKICNTMDATRALV